jgi:hypothetical protein
MPDVQVRWCTRLLAPHQQVAHFVTRKRRTQCTDGATVLMPRRHSSLRLQGVIAQVVPARPSLLQTTDASRCYPPVLFAHMAAKDPAWAEQVQGALLYCRWAHLLCAVPRRAVLFRVSRGHNRSALTGSPGTSRPPLKSSHATVNWIPAGGQVSLLPRSRLTRSP